MASQLIVVDLTKGGQKVDFSELTREPTDSLMFYVGEEHEAAHLHQFSYNPEFSNWQKLEFCIFWDHQHRPTAEDPRVVTDTELYIRKLCRQYEVAIDGYMLGVKHFGQRTIVEFKMKEEIATPLTLDWTKVEPPPREVIV
ncbi:hypothetical protein [Pseudomonas phage vB_PaeM_PS119XW]|uniref:Uncharacterized protein n=1 Tax=Pseudomonas phage vB_PaeM_PS119XW TaxID=2601632 RepID=A0A5C1K9W1_9CAUD|nr:hypothetical protein PP933_gp365 [Pseudomonas phage vB_PaeM_PS119XW]QEM42094.1 hypothetical protein [Pseudomonas phage vB_PaeM_PS119XW]